MTPLVEIDDPRKDPRWDKTFYLDEATHTYYRGNGKLTGITSVLKAVGIISDEETRWYNDKARDRGTAVHKCTHYLDEGDLDWSTVKDEWVGFVMGWEKFKRDWNFKPRLIELPLYDPLYGFAGTMDREGLILDNSPAIVEIKTGEVPHWAAEQTAGQEVLLNAWDRKPVRRRRFCVGLKADGTYRPPVEFKNPRDRNTFLAAVTVLHRIQQTTNGG